MRAQTSWVHVLAVDGLIVAGWLASVGAVLLYEGGHFLGGAINPLATLRATLDANEQWFGLYYKGQKIGYAQTMLIPEERGGVPGVAMTDRGRLSFNLLGIPQQVDLSARAFIDADWRLQQFDAQLRSDTYRLEWSGRRVGDSLVMTVATDGSRSTSRIRDPGGSALVVGLSPWTAFHRLSVGQWGKLWMLNPLALAPEAAYFHVRAREVMDGEDVLVIDTDLRGMTTTSWVTPDGEVLREESPLGWELVRESRELAFRTPLQAPTVDLLSTTAVPIDRTFDDPARLARLVWLVEGLGRGDLDVDRPWQTVLPPERLAPYRAQRPEGAWCLLELRRPTRPQAVPEIPATVERYQRPSPFVQSDDARIRAQALEVVAGTSDPWRAVVALNQWVYRSLAKRLTVGLPSAVDVLVSKSGDCHEHTVLFTALARSAGLPTRMVAGLVYYDGRLYYHAWPEVWLGAWVPTDPTLGQPLADATHLGLIEAENEALIELGKFVGQLRVSVLEAEEE
jgi:hypothetical protein